MCANIGISYVYTSNIWQQYMFLQFDTKKLKNKSQMDKTTSRNKEYIWQGTKTVPKKQIQDPSFP